MNENTQPPNTTFLQKPDAAGMDAARMLISPPPEEELDLQRTQGFGFPRTNTSGKATAQTKRKRAAPAVGGGTTTTPSKTPMAAADREPVEATPNPKPRKTHRRRTSSQSQLLQLQQQHAQHDSPTRASFASPRPRPRPSANNDNPNADYVPPAASIALAAASSRRRSRSASVTPAPVPYEPPTDVFTPPREVFLAPVPPPTRTSTRKAAKAKTTRSRTSTPVHAQRASATPLRVVVHSIKKEPMPPIDLARPMTPPSPTDDPLLLLPSSSPVKRNRHGLTSDIGTSPSSDAAYSPFDWTKGLQIPEQDDLTSDSMDLDVPESFDGPLPASGPFDTSASGGWDSDDDDEGVLPTTSTTHTRQGLTVEPSFTETTPTHMRPMATQPSSAYAHTRATTVPPTPSFAVTSPSPGRALSLGLGLPTPDPSLASIPSSSSTSTSTSTSLATPTTHATTPRTNTAITPATEDVVQDATLPTKPDPPTPRTQARMERWGVWGSPWPGRGPLEEGEGSFRMDGRSLRRLADASSALAFAPTDSDATGGAHQEKEEMQAGAQEEEHQEEDEDEDESADEGVSFLRALREDDARRRAAREGSGAVSPQRAERGGEEEDEEGEEDDREQEEEEAEVRAMSVDPDPESEGEEAEEKGDEVGDGDEDEDKEMPSPAPTPAHAQPHPEPRFVVRTPVPVRPTPPSAFDFTSTNEQAQITPLRIQAAHAHAHAQTPPTRRAPTVPVRSERVVGAVIERSPVKAASSSSFRADSLGQQAQARAQDAEAGAESGRDGQGEGSEARKEQDERRTTPPVLIAVGTRVEVPRTPTRGGAPPQSLGMGRGRRASFIQADPDVDADAEMDDTSTEGVVGGDGDVEGEAGVEGDGDDGGSDEEDAALLGLVKITSADPRAAARAAAILKQHDYDCFTRLRHNGKDKGRRRHSFAGVSKASMPSPLAQKSKTPGLVRTGGMQDIAELRAAYSKGKEREVQEMEVHQKRRESTPAPARVVGERVYFPGSPKPVTTAQLLEEAEREVVASGVTSASPRRVGAGESASVKGESILTHAHRRTSARGVPLPESDDEDDGAEKEEGREWTKADWKALDACFTDERIAVAARLGMVLNLSPAPQPGAPSTPVRTTLASAGSSSNNTSTPAVMMASADAVDLSAVVGRFVKLKGGERVVKQWGEKWDVENLTQRARALQNKQRAGHVAPPTPSATTDVFAGDRRRASMVVPDFTPLGKRAMPPRVSSASRPMSPLVNGINRAMPLSTRAQLPQPVSAGAPFSNLPPTPEPARRRRVPGSLFAPRYSHLLEEAVAVSGGPAPRASEGEMETEESEDVSFAEDQDTGLSEEHSQEQEQEQQQDSSFESSVDDEDAEMVPATPLREREDSQYPATTQPAEPATIGKRVKGFLFSYLPTMAKTAPPPTRRPPTHAGPRLPLPPLELLEKPRGPVTTPARPPLPKTRAPKELVSLQPAPPPKPKSMLPRRAPPKRLVELHHVEPPVEEQPRVPFTRPRTSSGGSVKDLVKNFEALKGANATAKGAEVKRVRSVGDFGGKKPGSAAGAGRPMWRP